jgi:hypothetical protein
MSSNLSCRPAAPVGWTEWVRQVEVLRIILDILSKSEVVSEIGFQTLFDPKTEMISQANSTGFYTPFGLYTLLSLYALSSLYAPPSLYTLLGLYAPPGLCTLFGSHNSKYRIEGST